MKVRHVLSAFSVGLLAACGNDNGIGPSSGDRFTAEEAVEVAMAFNSSLSGAGSGASAASIAASQYAGASVPQNVHMSVSQTVPCELGGQTALSITVDGTVDDATQSMNLSMNGTNAPAACVIPVQDLTVTINGTPRLANSAHMEIASGVPVGTWTAGGEGSFAWAASDGRSGSCSVRYTMSMNFTAQTVSLTGHFCGADIEYSGPMNPGTA